MQAQTSGPRYFNLLWDHELKELEPLLGAVQARREDVLDHWYSLYLLHFGESRSLPRSEFLRIFGRDLDAVVDDLRIKDFASFTENLRRVSESLEERHVPFSEVIVSMHLFEESATRVFPPDIPASLYVTFDKLSHCRIIVLADAYFRSYEAESLSQIISLERETALLAPHERRSFHGMIGASPAMRLLYERIEAAAATRGTVLIVGESGTGKELVARAIHECGPDPHAPFIALNCAAVPRELLESEMFGYKRGAFSGATGEYQGLFRAASGGTFFLDEITEMAAQTQTKLLRAIQERTVRPVGATHEVAVDVRLIASTNTDPQAAVLSGQLREDLYYRLQVNVLRVPPLRERLDDIPVLIEYFITLFNERLMKPQPIMGIEQDALSVLQHYQWPGNVRELRNAIESAFTFSRSSTITLEDLPPLSGGKERRNPVPAFAEAERDLIRRALLSVGGNKVQAAKLLRISRKKLYAKIRKYDLPQERKKWRNFGY
jgi:DNA-binding NtrC family response regulator